jgi:putative FmdB family regulatory protein
MPTYDYQCSECKLIQEFHKMSESPEVKCSVCGKKMKKIISVGVEFSITKGGTRKSVQKYKKVSYTPTPSESAQAKAIGAAAEKQHNEEISNDPYGKFRNL